MSEEIKVQELENAAGGGETEKGTAKGGYKVYITEANDTLWGISQKYKVDVWVLFRENKPEITKWFKKMNPGKAVPADDSLINYLYIGERILIPPTY